MSKMYDQNGRACEVVVEANNVSYVRYWFNEPGDFTQEGEYLGDELVPVKTLYAEPPTHVYDKQITQLIERCEVQETRLEELNNKLNLSAQTLREVEQTTIRAKEAAKKYDCIQTAIDFLEGKITHCVVVPAYTAANIQTVEEAFKVEDDGYHSKRDKRLLALFGRDRPEGMQVVWRVNRYCDHSGDWTDIYPCRSQEEAQTLLQSFAAKAIADWRTGKDKNTIKYYAAYAPKEWHDEQAATKEQERLKAIENLKIQLAKLEQP